MMYDVSESTDCYQVELPFGARLLFIEEGDADEAAEKLRKNPHALRRYEVDCPEGIDQPQVMSEMIRLADLDR